MKAKDLIKLAVDRTDILWKLGREYPGALSFDLDNIVSNMEREATGGKTFFDLYGKVLASKNPKLENYLVGTPNDKLKDIIGKRSAMRPIENALRRQGRLPSDVDAYVKLLVGIRRKIIAKSIKSYLNRLKYVSERLKNVK